MYTKGSLTFSKPFAARVPNANSLDIRSTTSLALLTGSLQPDESTFSFREPTFRVVQGQGRRVFVRALGSAGLSRGRFFSPLP